MYLEAYKYYKKNILPNGKGYFDEAIKYGQLMDFIESKMMWIEQQEEKKIKAQQRF